MRPLSRKKIRQMARLSIWLGNTRHAAMNYANSGTVTRSNAKSHTDHDEGAHNFQIHHVYTSPAFATQLSTFRATAADVCAADRATWDLLMVASAATYAGLEIAKDEGIRMALPNDFATTMHDAIAAIGTSTVNNSGSTTGAARVAHGKCIWSIGYIYKANGADDAENLAYVSDVSNIAFK